MKTQYAVALAVAAFGLGAGAIQGLHAQAKPPVYYVAEINVTNADAYAKEFLPGARKLITANGGRYIAAGKATPVEGAPPAARVAVLAFDNMEKIQAWRNSADFKENRKIGDKYATFRSFAVDGVAQ